MGPHSGVLQSSSPQQLTYLLSSYWKRTRYGRLSSCSLSCSSASNMSSKLQDCPANATRTLSNLHKQYHHPRPRRAAAKSSAPSAALASRSDSHDPHHHHHNRHNQDNNNNTPGARFCHPVEKGVNPMSKALSLAEARSQRSYHCRRLHLKQNLNDTDQSH